MTGKPLLLTAENYSLQRMEFPEFLYFKSAAMLRKLYISNKMQRLKLTFCLRCQKMNFILSFRKKRRAGANDLCGLSSWDLPPETNTEILEQARIRMHTLVQELSETQFKSLVQAVKQNVVLIDTTNGFDNAQVCAGGISTIELNARTMESRYIKGLYLTGELLDADGICGGYNLQWAWATGYLAGKAAADTQ